MNDEDKEIEEAIDKAQQEQSDYQEPEYLEDGGEGSDMPPETIEPEDSDLEE